MNKAIGSLRSVSIVGARPQFVKLAPVARAMRRAEQPIEDRVVHTGQHYDAAMSDVFFKELDLPHPTVNLGIGSGPQGRQTGRMLEALEAYLTEHRPDLVIVYGDTNSTVAGALAAAKLHIPVAHIEAGLRSFNRAMPEELNRIVTDHISELLLAPTQTAMRNLTSEGLASRSVLSGDVMYDAVLDNARRAREHSRVLQSLGLTAGEYGVLTLHRAENTSAERLSPLLQLLNSVAREFGPLIFPAHPRTTARIRLELPEYRPDPALHICEPVGYLDMLKLIQGARWVLTDSGGLQKEAYFLRCPCITLRDETEWIETLADGANHLAGSDGAGLMDLLASQAALPVRDGDEAIEATPGPFGDGRAAQRIVSAVCEYVRARA